MFENTQKKETIREFAYAFSGCLIYALGFNLFIAPLGLYSGGFIGVSQLIELAITNVLGITLPASLNLVGILYFVINVPLFYVSFKVMAKAYTIKSIITVIVLSAVLMFVPIPTEPIIHDYLTASIIGGLIGGVGSGFILRGRMAGGGPDIIGVCLAKKFQGFTVGKVNIAINAFVFAICLFIYNVEVVVYSLIFNVIFALTVDKIHIRNINMSAMIFTKKTGIAKAVMEEMRRGVTDWEGEGAYTGDKTYILYVILSKYEIVQLKEIVHRIDPNAFVIITEGCVVDGNFEKRL